MTTLYFPRYNNPWDNLHLLRKLKKKYNAKYTVGLINGDTYKYYAVQEGSYIHSSNDGSEESAFNVKEYFKNRKVLKRVTRFVVVNDLGPNLRIVKKRLSQDCSRHWIGTDSIAVEKVCATYEEAKAYCISRYEEHIQANIKAIQRTLEKIVNISKSKGV